MQGKLQSTLLFIRKIRIKVVAGMAWWCENAFPSLLQPAIQTSTAFTVNNRLTLTKMHHIGIGKVPSFINSWTNVPLFQLGGLQRRTLQTHSL